MGRQKELRTAGILKKSLLSDIHSIMLTSLASLQKVRSASFSLPSPTPPLAVKTPVLFLLWDGIE